MPHDKLLQDDIYDPNRLLNALQRKLRVKNDAALCRRLDLSASAISKIRHGVLPESPRVSWRPVSVSQAATA